KVPATVVSLCLQFNLRPMAPVSIREHLTQVLQAENVASEPQALRLLARAARGSMRDALSLTDQAIAFGSGQLQEASVRQMLGSVDRSYVFQLLDALARGDGKSVVETSEVLRLNGLSAASTLEEMATVLQRMAVLQAVPGIGAGDDESDPDVAATARLAQALPADETQLLYSLCLHGRAELGLAPDDYAALTMVLLRLLAFKPADAAMAVAAGGAVEPPKKSLPDSAPVAAGAAPAIPQPMEPNRPPIPETLAQRAPDFIASSPRPPQVETTAPAPDSSLGDVWTALVNRMVAAETVAALARELALQSELRAQAEGVWTLRVERESLNQAAAREKLQLALQAALQDSGQAVQLAVELGPVSDSPARRNAAAQMERQRQAEETIQNDPFVQDMMRDWGAKIVPGSIKPLASKPI
ncbi:MAG: DNA polymerase III subunit gamma/tau C-terminal domain-containing protein, partial [Polaromonas sp.]|nr:DNA polymerase III subunit gamma/tau C-terminal domain-containing protein [Polaromonas sp.]